MENYHILLVEDMPDILEYNRKALAKKGYHVSVAQTFKQAKKTIDAIETRS